MPHRILLKATQGSLHAQVQCDAFNDCILMGYLGQAVFGSTLQSYPTLFVSPFLMAGAARRSSHCNRSQWCIAVPEDLDLLERK